MRNFFFIAIFILAGASCSKLPQLGPATDSQLATASQDACGFVQNSYGQRISWKSRLPIKLYVHPDFPTQYDDSLKAAAKKWEDAAGMSLFDIQFMSSSTTSSPTMDSTNVIYWMTDWDEADKALQAVTSLHWAGSVLTDADMKIDAHFYNFYISTPSAYADIQMESLLIHELGHVLGLKHQTLAPTVMWATLAGSTLREDLSTTDITSLKCEY